MENTEYIKIRIQDHTGDRKLMLTWDAGDTESAKIAQERMEEMFLDLQNNGYRFYSCKKVLGVFKKKGEEIKTYDPKLGAIIYEEQTSKNEKVSFKEIEKPRERDRMIEQEMYIPKEHEIDTNRDYVATAKMTPG